MLYLHVVNDISPSSCKCKQIIVTPEIPWHKDTQILKIKFKQNLDKDSRRLSSQTVINIPRETKSKQHSQMNQWIHNFPEKLGQIRELGKILTRMYSVWEKYVINIPRWKTVNNIHRRPVNRNSQTESINNIPRWPVNQKNLQPLPRAQGPNANEM